MKSHSPPSEPKLEDFSLTEDDVKNVEKHLQHGEMGTGCTVLFAGPLVFVSLAIFIAIPVAAFGGGKKTILWIAGIITFYFVMKLFEGNPSKVEVSESLINLFHSYKKASDDYRTKLYEYNQTQKDYWFSMSGHAFEEEFGELLKKDGFKVSQTKGSGDGGVDLVATKNEAKIIIQCKAWKNPVGPAPVRELQGVREKNQQAWVVGLGGFTKGAKEFAIQKDIKLLEYKDVNQMVMKRFT
jgi:hypothetical protein